MVGFIRLSIEAKRVAKDMARQGLTGRPDDPLPNLLPVTVEREINRNILMFSIAVNYFRVTLSYQR